MSIKASGVYSIEKWKEFIESNNCDNAIDTCLKTICYNYYNNNVIIDLLLQKYKDNKDTTNRILLYIINNIPCYNLNKYIKLYNKTNDTKIKANKQLTALITSLWAYESFINKKNYNTFENARLKLIRTKSLNKWLEYFGYLLENKVHIDHLYIINTFERFLQITPSYLKVWLLYIEFIKDIKKENTKDVFIYYHRLNSIKTINIIYKTMDPNLKIYIKTFYLNEIKQWYNKLMEDDGLCKDADVVSNVFKLIRNLRDNNDSLDTRDENRLLVIYLTILQKHLSIKYKARFIDIVSVLLDDFGFSSEHDKSIKTYLVSKNLNNHFAKVNDTPINQEILGTFSKFIFKALIFGKSVDHGKNQFNSSLKHFICYQTPKSNNNQIITYNNIIKITKKYGTIDDYKQIIIHLKKHKAKQNKPKTRRVIKQKHRK
ncbi:hypothetical protein DAHU10_022600 [Hanseniaspora uvarum]|nr:hypothetical protein DAHU10_022600 [Hanseniaspora uvarum]